MISWVMFFYSFMPLWICVTFIDICSLLSGENNITTEIISVSVIVIGTILSSYVSVRWLRSSVAQKNDKYEVVSARRERFKSAEFLATFVLPLVAFDFTLWKDVVLFLVFFGCLFILVAKNDYYCTNLVLEIFDYKVYSCVLMKNDIKIQKMIVSRKSLETLGGEIIYTRKYNNDYQFDVGIRKNVS